jgi:hypothetical protein
VILVRFFLDTSPREACSKYLPILGFAVHSCSHVLTTGHPPHSLLCSSPIHPPFFIPHSPSHWSLSIFYPPEYPLSPIHGGVAFLSESGGHM